MGEEVERFGGGGGGGGGEASPALPLDETLTVVRKVQRSTK